MFFSKRESRVKAGRATEPQRVKVEQPFTGFVDIAELKDKLSKKQEPARPNQPFLPVDVPCLSDQDLLEKAFNSKNGTKIRQLYNGDWSDHPSHSEGDLALCSHLAFWLDRDPVRIDAAFRSSGLMREQWDKKHFNDGRTYGQGTIREAIDGTKNTYQNTASEKGSNHSAQASISMEDQSPLPLMRKNEQGEPFPMDCLGEIGYPAAKMILKIIKAPDAVCAHAILGFMSFTIQGYANIIIDGRKYPLNEFFLSICSRSGRKSETDKAAGYVHRKIQRLRMQEYGAEKLRYRDDLEAHNKSKADINSDKFLSFEEKKTALSKLREQEPTPPYEPVILFSDPTIEGIHKLFERGTPSKFLCADEGGLVSGGHSMTAEKQMYTAATYSKWWDAAPIDRIRGGDGASILYGRRLSCHLMMQEKVALEFFSNELMRNQGLLSRFIVAYPESLVGQRAYESVNLSETPEIQAYYEHVEQLLKIPLPMRIDKKTDLVLNEIEPRTIAFELDAKKLWTEAYEDIEAESGKGRMFEVIEGFAGKAAAHIIRLAGILAVFDNVHCRTVKKPYVERAVNLMEYYLNERVRITAMAMPDQTIVSAQKLLNWIHEKKMRVVTLPDIYRCGPRQIKSANDARRTARILTDHGWIQKLDKSHKSEIDQRKSREAWKVIDEKI